jgi:hypothetical protein
VVEKQIIMHMQASFELTWANTTQNSKIIWENASRWEDERNCLWSQMCRQLCGEEGKRAEGIWGMKSVQDTSFIISLQFLTKHRQEVHIKTGRTAMLTVRLTYTKRDESITCIL